MDGKVGGVQPLCHGKCLLKHMQGDTAELFVSTVKAPLTDGRARCRCSSFAVSRRSLRSVGSVQGTCSDGGTNRQPELAPLSAHRMVAGSSSASSSSEPSSCLRFLMLRCLLGGMPADMTDICDAAATIWSQRWSSRSGQAMQAEARLKGACEGLVSAPWLARPEVRFGIDQGAEKAGDVLATSSPVHARLGLVRNSVWRVSSADLVRY